MNISDQLRSEEKSKPLHEIRYNEMKNRALESAVNASLNQNSPKGFDCRGKDLYVKPLVYYNPQDCLRNAMTDSSFIEKAKKNIDIIKAKRESEGQKLCVKSNMKDVLGEFPEKTNETKYGYEKVAMITFIREWQGYICEFEIKRQPVGFGNTKRTGYTFNKCCVIYYGKNGVKLSKEQILRISFWMWNKVADKDGDKENKDKK